MLVKRYGMLIVTFMLTTFHTCNSLQSMGSGPNWYQICRRKRKSMFTGLKGSSLACKCAFHKAEHNAKGGTPWN